MTRDEILPLLNRPSRYCGNEHNAVFKDWDAARLRVALAFPDLYEIGMSHQGLQILYHIINRMDGALAERVYAPDLDLESALRQRGLPLFSLESGRPLADFDLIGVTLPYELCYSNILTILDLAGLPLLSRERGPGHPIVMAGGPCAFNPEPVADFFDAVLVGDGEEAVPDICRRLMAAREAGLDRDEILLEVSAVEGVYVPAFFEPRHDGGGRYTGTFGVRGGKERVRRAVVADLDSQPSLAEAPLVPQTRIVHDRLGLEIARGCTRGCRFCQAGIIYRPVRERRPQTIFDLARRGIAASGFDELALLSLSTGDYSCLAPLLARLMDEFAREHVSVSMPSMRVGTLTQEIMEQVRRVRKTGFTIAPEAGTDRLRRVINKGITEDDLLDTVAGAFSLGWKIIKLYFMFGLPFETEDDVRAIGSLVARALERAPGGGRGKRVTVSVGTFVPKPHTPFQWHRQLSIEESFDRVRLLKEVTPRGAALKWHDPRMSFLEGVFARGDRSLAAVILQAWRDGARLDAWAEHFSLERWQAAAERQGVDLEAFPRRRALDEPLPWDHIDPGVESAFLRRELERAAQGAYTADCRYHGCAQCGLCDFKVIRPRVHGADAPLEPVPAPSAGPSPEAGGGRFFYWVHYRRLGEARFLGHLELLQLVFRGIKRAGLPVLFSKGFNPSPRVSFSPALAVGMESLAEYFIVETSGPLPGLSSWRERISRAMPKGVEVFDLAPGPAKPPRRVEMTYRAWGEGLEFPVARMESFLGAGRFDLEVVRKKKRRVIDLRPLVLRLEAGPGGSAEFCLVSDAGATGVKPAEFLASVFALDKASLSRLRIRKLSWREAAG